MTALKHLHYKDFSLKVTGCKKELKERGQIIRIQNSPFLAWSAIPCFLTKSQIFGQSAGTTAVCREVYYIYEPPAEGRGVLGLIFAGYVSLASQNPYPIIVCILWPHYRPHLSLWLWEISSFCNPNLVTFCLCIYLKKPFSLVILRNIY